MRKKATNRGRLAWILAAGVAGYLLGGWHAAALLRVSDPSPAQTVALRFPLDGNGAAAADDATVTPASLTDASSGVLGSTQLALLSPDPMIAPSAPSASVQAAAPAPAVQPPPAAVAPRAKPVAAPRPIAETKVAMLAPPPAARHVERAGFMLDDAQIASIRQRLHLTPDQERMWPAVEAALRNIAYEKARERRRGNAATEIASLDPNGAAVQDLKSAAIPLIMSFNDDQRNEVRSLAHVMGLDRLASEF
jgi:hypothetical protein